MGRFIRLRHRRSNLYVVEETIAALHEELEFTLKYAQAMSRDENFQAAVEVIEEQRRSLARASERMNVAMVEPGAERSRFRVRAALAGVAATLAIASGAVAGLGGGTSHPTQNAQVQAIHRATEALTGATATSDPVAYIAIAAQAQDTFLDIARISPTDPTIKQSLLDSVERLRDVVQNTTLPQKVREQAKRVAEQVEEIMVSTPEVPESEEAPDHSAETDAAGADPAPSPNPSV